MISRDFLKSGDISGLLAEVPAILSNLSWSAAYLMYLNGQDEVQPACGTGNECISLINIKKPQADKVLRLLPVNPESLCFRRQRITADSGIFQQPWLAVGYNHP